MYTFELSNHLLFIYSLQNHVFNINTNLMQELCFSKNYTIEI